MTKEELTISVLKKFRQYGYQINTGDIFYQVIYEGKEQWGWKVGQYTHSCPIDTTCFVVLMFINDDSSYTTFKAYADHFIIDSLTV